MRCPRLFVPAVVAAVVSPLPAAAGGAPIHLRYEAYWGGLYAADFLLSMGQQGDTYENGFHLRTRGLIDLFIRLEVSAESRGQAPPIAALAPRHYRVDYANRWRQRALTIRFDPRSGEATATMLTVKDDDPDGDGPDEILARGLRTHVLDPLVSLSEAIRRLRGHLAGGPKAFRLAVFDGRRRFDVAGAYLGVLRREILRRKHDVHRLRLTTIPIAGFKSRHRVLWDGSAFDLFLSRDGRFVPLQIVSLGLGPVINLVEQCPRACALPAD